MNDRLLFRQIVSVLAIIAVIVVAAQLWDYFNGSSFSPIAPVYSALRSGDYAVAASNAQEALSQHGASLSSEDTTWAHLIIADSYMLGSTSTVATQDGSLASIITDYQGLTDPFSRAWELDRLVESAASSNEASLTAALSGNVELDAFLASSSAQTTSNLAAYSYSIYPTSAAAYYAAFSEARAIFGNYAQHSPGTGLTTLKDDVLLWIQKGDALRAIEMQYASSSPYGTQAYNAMTAYYRSLPISALALMDSSRMSDAQATYQTIYDAYASTQAAGGDYPQVVLAVASAHLTEAYTLYLAGPTANAAAIDGNLRSMISLVQANPDLLQRFTTSFGILRDPSSAASLGFNADEIAALSTQHAIYVQMAAVSSAFKAFLVSQGWTLNQ